MIFSLGHCCKVAAWRDTPKDIGTFAQSCFWCLGYRSANASTCREQWQWRLLTSIKWSWQCGTVLQRKAEKHMYIQNPRGETMCILLYFSDSAFESLRRLVRWILIEFLRWIPLNPFIESLTESLHWTPLNPFIESLHWIHSLHPLLHPFIQFLWMPSSKPFIESLSLNCCKNNKTSRGRQLVLGVGLSCNDSCWQWLRCWQWQWQARHESGLPWQSSMGWPGVRLGIWVSVRGYHHCRTSTKWPTARCAINCDLTAWGWKLALVFQEVVQVTLSQDPTPRIYTNYTLIGTCCLTFVAIVAQWFARTNQPLFRIVTLHHASWRITSNWPLKACQEDMMWYSTI